VIAVLDQVSNKDIILPCLRIVGNVLMGGSANVKLVLDLKAIPVLQKHLIHEE
jgi:hypothetical protein